MKQANLDDRRARSDAPSLRKVGTGAPRRPRALSAQSEGGSSRVPRNLLHPLERGRGASQREAPCQCASKTPSLRRVPLCGLLLCAATLLGGCLSRPSLVKESFAFSPSPPPLAVAAGNGPVLGIRKLAIAPPFDSQSLVYRTGEFSYEQDPYAQFLGPPAEILPAPVRGFFRDTGAFGAVAEPGSALQPEVLAEIYIDRLYGDFRDPKAPLAVLAMHFIFFDARQGLVGGVLLQSDYDRRVPLKARTAVALIAGWDIALREIVTKAASDLQAAEVRMAKPLPHARQ